jgi:hypothetical protein
MGYRWARSISGFGICILQVENILDRGAVGALMVFDLTARQTFEKLDRWIT